MVAALTLLWNSPDSLLLLETMKFWFANTPSHICYYAVVWLVVGVGVKVRRSAMFVLSSSKK
jgi:hypothetical protein